MSKARRRYFKKFGMTDKAIWLKYRHLVRKEPKCARPWAYRNIANQFGIYSGTQEIEKLPKP